MPTVTKSTVGGEVTNKSTIKFPRMHAMKNQSTKVSPRLHHYADEDTSRDNNTKISWRRAWETGVWIVFFSVYVYAAYVGVVQRVREEIDKMPSRSELPLAKAAFDASRKFDATKLDDSPIFMCLITLGFYGFSFKSSDFSTIAGGLMFSAVIFASELLNALFFHFTHYSPLWISNPLKTQMQLTVGLNMESVFLTLLLGFVFSLFIPSKKMIFFCLPARLMWAFMGAIFAAALQLFLLNPMGIITFKYSWWGGADFLSMSNVMLFGYLSAFVLACWMHGIPYPVIKVALPVSLLLFELGVFIFLGPICHWI